MPAFLKHRYFRSGKRIWKNKKIYNWKKLINDNEAIFLQVLQQKNK